jgi:hypothetical protein
METKEELIAWETWQERCALELLSEPMRAGICQVMADRFRSRVRQVSHLPIFGNNRPDVPDNRKCAHLFESYCALHQRRDGKSYKRWLLTRGKQDVDTIQSGVMLLMRNVVREWIRDCHPRTADRSLHDVTRLNITLEECLPEADAPHQISDEVAEWMQTEQSNWIEELNAPEVAMLRARCKGLIFSDPRVQQETGISKTTLHKYHREVMVRWAGRLREKFPEIGAETGAGLILEAMDAIGEILLTKSAEKSGSPAFGVVKDDASDG